MKADYGANQLLLIDSWITFLSTSSSYLVLIFSISHSLHSFNLLVAEYFPV
jgi:hypothetical protein